MTLLPLPAMPTDWEPTRETLHSYANVLGVLPRAHAVPHPKWWHISLKVRPSGLVTDTMPLPGGGTVSARMDLRSHNIVLDTSRGEERSVSMTEGRTGTGMGDQVLAAAADLGLSGDYALAKYESDDARIYDVDAAGAYFAAVVNIHHNLAVHRSTLDGPVGPIQIWPHGFDLAFEWYGTKTESHDEGGETTVMPSQLNLGFYPAGRAYFYSNPWPFDADALTSQALPEPAAWNTEGWQGSILYYDELLKTDNPPQLLLEYAKAVYETAAPTLLAD